MIAIKAMARIGEKYATVYALKMGMDHYFQKIGMAPRYAPTTLGVICSQLFNDSHLAVCEKLVVAGKPDNITPGQLSYTDRLSDVPISFSPLDS